MRQFNTPAVSFAVIDNGQIAYARAYGARQAGTRRKVDDGTLFQAASVSKTVTAIGVMALVQAGLIAIDVDVNQQLRSWQLPGDPGTVTPRLLLDHGGGINVHGFSGYAKGKPLPSLMQILNGTPPANNSPIRVESPPGTKYAYSGGGYEVLEALVEDVTRRRFADVMQSLVLHPVGADGSGFWKLLPIDHMNVASGHDKNGKLIKGNWKNYPELAAAGLWTNATDLANIVLELFGKNQVLTPDTAASMLTAQKPLRTGLGVELHGKGDGMWFEKGGDNSGYKNSIVGFPATGQGLVFLSNSDIGSCVKNGVVAMVADAQGWPLNPFANAKPC